MISREEACAYINATPALQSLLYDINRLPECCDTSDAELTMLMIVAHWRAAFGENATPCRHEWFEGRCAHCRMFADPRENTAPKRQCQTCGGFGLIGGWDIKESTPCPKCARGASGNYVANDDTFPTKVTFFNGRVVKIVDGHLAVGWADDGTMELLASPPKEPQQ